MDNQFFSLGRRAENVDAIGERDGIYANREGCVQATVDAVDGYSLFAVDGEDATHL